MKKEMIVKAYETPMAKEVLIQVEGVLCESKVGLFHDEFEDGGSLPF